MIHRLGTGCILLATLVANLAAAQESGYPGFTFNGFGTLGVVHSSEDQADFRNSVRQPDGAGYSHDWALGVDSRLGLQGTAKFSDKLTAQVQVISEQDADDTYAPDVEWANLKYEVTPQASIRLGRTVLPTFMISEFRKVGFANPRVRPPPEVYSLVPVTNNDGIDAIYQFRTGERINTLRAYVGESDFPVPGAGTFEARRSYGLSGTVELEQLAVRAGYSHSHLTAGAINSLFDGFRQLGPQGRAIADRFDLDHTPIEVLTVGVNYDPGDWFVRSEWARTRSPSFLGTETGWYVTGGLRFGSFTPYAGFGQSRREDHAAAIRLDTTALPPAVRDEAAALNASLEFFTRPNDYDSVTIGTRWDFRRDADIKLQLDHIRLKDGSFGELANAQPGFEPGGHVNVFSVAVEFVF